MNDLQKSIRQFNDQLIIIKDEENLQKAKFIRRWKDKKGKWQYEYGDSKKNETKRKDEEIVDNNLSKKVHRLAEKFYASKKELSNIEEKYGPYTLGNKYPVEIIERVGAARNANEESGIELSKILSRSSNRDQTRMIKRIMDLVEEKKE